MKKPTRRNKKTKAAAAKVEKSSESGKGDVNVRTSKNNRRMDDLKLIPKLVMDAQDRNAVAGLFLQFKNKGGTPEWNDISAQGAEIKSYWAQ